MVTKYIIMCGGNYKKWETPRQLSIICGEEVVARTIRLLKENGIKDINISSNNPVFEKFGVPVLKHNNYYVANGFKSVEGYWFNAFYPTDEPVCYIFGDVVFSPEAIKTIVETETDDMEFFGSKQPFDERYIKTHEEPFALKVVNQKHLREAIEKTKELDKQHLFWRKPIMWELWTVIKETPLQTGPGNFPAEYVAINDYTCDIDFEEDIKKMNLILGGIEMIKCEVIERFTLGRFKELRNIVRATSRNNDGELYVGDTFECEKELADYLLGGNDKKKTVVKVVEVIPAKKEVFVKADTSALEEVRPIPIKEKKAKKRTSKK